MPAQEVNALGLAMLRLVEDRDERLRMGEAALRSSKVYDLSVIIRRWEDYIEERLAAKAAR
ncbi:hypothetical protein [Allosalinactinospora lopnorensis]